MYQNNFDVTKGASHAHTDNSLHDGFQSVDSLCKTLKEKGAEVAFISDHGTCMGWDDFDQAAKKVGIRPIFGVEAYYTDESEMRMHLLLYAKNEEGMRQIQLAMSRGKVITTAKDEDSGVTCLTDQALELLKGGNVIATSACIAGVFGSIPLYNMRLDKKIQKAEGEVKKMTEGLDYQAKKNAFENADQDFVALKKRLSEAKAAGKKSFSAKQKQIERRKNKLEAAQAAFERYLVEESEKSAKSVIVKLAQLEQHPETPDDFQDALERAKASIEKSEKALSAAMHENEALAASVNELETAVAELQQKRADAKKVFDEASKVMAKANNREDTIRELKKKKLSKKDSLELFKTRYRKMHEVFGAYGNFYMEVQNHGLQEEAAIYPWLAQFARSNNIPLVAANDAHYSRRDPDEMFAWLVKRSNRFKKWEAPKEDSSEYYLKTDDELSDALLKILPADMVDEAMRNVAKIADECRAEIRKESHAPKAKSADPAKELMEIARAAIPVKYSGDKKWTAEYEERLMYETKIIHEMGFDDYFLIVWDIIRIARMVGGLSYEKLDELKASMDNLTMEQLMSFITTYNTEPNLSVGLGRGSGAGSIVCYLMGITNVDPIEHNLLFERFLNPERISMPDIDTDFRSDIKDVLLRYMKLRYGDRAIAQILTKSYLKGKSSIDRASKMLALRDDSNYLAIAKKLKNKPGIDFNKPLSDESNKSALMDDCGSDIEAEIAKTAVLIDGSIDHIGLHAAGVIISDNEDLAEHIPVAWDVGSKTWKTQCDMIQCEGKHGLLKIDALLLKTLDIITYTLRLIKKYHPNDKVDIENLPIEKEVFQKIYAAGDTKAVFQFESAGMVSFLKRLNPTEFVDIVAANAMYRPGPMDAIPDYIKAKMSGNIKYDCPQLEPILSNTYGQIIFQEQVMRIVRDLAGYSLGRSDLVRRAMAKKHEDELLAERKNFIYGNPEEGIHGCMGIGISEEAASKIFDKMIAFASYAFNLSHAVVYSMTSYMTAWLKYHYPAEFFCANLNYTDAQEKIPPLIQDTKKHGIQVLPPHANRSQPDFSIENGNIRFGLKFLMGAKSRASSLVQERQEIGGRFPSFKSFVSAQPGRQLAEAMILSGACDCYIGGHTEKRNALLKAYDVLADMNKDILSAKQKSEGPESAQQKKAAQDFLDLTDAWAKYKLPDTIPASHLEQLELEQKYTSVYFSGNPLDSFEVSGEYMTISEMEEGNQYWVAAVFSDKRDLKTKKSMAPMLAGKITDSTGSSVDAIIFPKEYAKIAPIMTDIMGFRGTLKTEEGEEPQFVIAAARALPKRSRQVMVWTEDGDREQVLGKIRSAASVTGYQVCLISKSAMEATEYKVSESFLKESGLKFKVR